MAKCKYCHEDITRLDKEVCPFCGGSRPLDGTDTQTQDMTKVIDQLDHPTEVKIHKKLVAALLAFFLGIFGADSFYLGKCRKGILMLVISLVFIGGIGSLIYFLGWNSPFAYLILYFVLEALMIGVGICYFVKGDITDNNGAFLK